MSDLKYLFKAELHNGTSYYQNKEDASVKFPPTLDDAGRLQGKSCMADIQEDIDTLNIKKFTLIEQKLLGAKIISVDLTDGHFEINGIPFFTEGDRPLPIKTIPYKLIFFRVRREQYMSPASYLNPQRVEPYGSSGIKVINSKGEVHTYDDVVRTWVQDEPLIDGTPVSRYFIQPKAKEGTTQYMLGWQTTIAGKNYQQVILID